ncbi:MAG: ABATE domain-containing protein, partial [Candidatus Limnocylindria bacterium]
MRNTLWPEPDHEMEIDAGHPALDLTNTAARPDADAAFAHEHLRSYGDLLRFAELAGLVDPAERRRLERQAAREPGRADAVLRRVRELREAA